MGVGEGKKKARNFGPPTLGPPPFGAPPFVAPSFRGPTPSAPYIANPWEFSSGLKSNDSRLAQVELAKVERLHGASACQQRACSVGRCHCTRPPKLGEPHPSITSVQEVFVRAQPAQRMTKIQCRSRATLLGATANCDFWTGRACWRDAIDPQDVTASLLLYLGSWR